MKQKMDIFFLGALVGFSVVLVMIFFIGILRQRKQDQKKQELTKPAQDAGAAEPEFTAITRRVTVADQTCCVKMVGIKTPKTIKEFTVVFQTETGEIMKLNIPEEMYDGFEKGQSGTVYVVDGELYSFELEESDTTVS